MLKIGDRVTYAEINSTNEYLATVIKIIGTIDKIPIIQFDDMPYPQGQQTMYINFITSLTKITE